MITKNQLIVGLCILAAFASCATENGADENEAIASIVYAPESEPQIEPQIEESLRLPAFLNLFRFSEHLRYMESILPEDTNLYGDDNSIIEIIPAGTGITLLARAIRNNYFLVKIDGDENLWSGWISPTSLSPETDAAARWQRSGERWFVPVNKEVGIRNGIFMKNTSWQGEFTVARKNGEIISRLSIPEASPGGATGGTVLGWTTDQTRIWFFTYTDGSMVNFGIFDITTSEFSIFPHPPYFSRGDEPFALDFDTGEMYYMRFWVDWEEGIEPRRGRIVDDLFFHNFFTQESRKVDADVGRDFRIPFDGRNGIVSGRVGPLG